MLTIIRGLLWLCAAICVTAATADAWMERWTGLFIAGIGTFLALAAVWTARLFGRQLALRNAQVQALAAECEELHDANRTLARVVGRLSGAVTKPFHVVR